MNVKKDITILSAVVLVFGMGMFGVIRVAPHDSASLGMVIAFATLGLNQILQRVGAMLSNQEAKQAVVDVKQTATKAADHAAAAAEDVKAVKEQTNGGLTDRIISAVKAGLATEIPKLKQEILAELQQAVAQGAPK